MNFKGEQSLSTAVLKKASVRGAAPAVSCGRAVLSYVELDRRSLELACVLRSHGVERNVPVAVWLERSPDLIVAILAALRAGGAFVPLDPALPRDRLAFMLADCAAPVLITKSSLRHADVSAPCVIELDRVLPSAPTVEWDAPAPDDPAYVIYTSGSTGKPKGVLCHHRGALNMLSDGQECCPLGPGDRCSWWTSPGFDVSIYELFSALGTGAELVIVPDEVRVEAAAFTNWLCEERITSAYVPPMMIAALEHWVEQHPGCSPLRRLLTGVEPISEGLLINIVRAIPELHLINGYGPTEAAVYCTRYIVTANGDPSRIAPIGTPLAGVDLYLLNESMQPVADGQDGEICIGGVQVEYGYLDRAELTARSFINNPFGEGVLYRTGDRAVRLSDGNLMFHGRADQQVKFRGYRIELGEISAELALVNGVREAVVIVREDSPGVQRLVAYYTVKSLEAPSPETLGAELAKTLPDYMVPSIFICLPALPETANGKIDRTALPTPTDEDLAHLRAEEFRPPVSDAEKKVAAVFESLLNISRAGRDDHFFMLGGHSLMATQALSRLGTGITLQDLYNHPTVKELAALLEDGGGQADDIPAAPQMDIYPLTGSQQTMWMMHHSDRSGTLSNIPVVIRLSGNLDVPVLTRALNEVIRRHDALRMVFSMEQGVPVQRPLDSVHVEIPLINLSQTAPDERTRRCAEIKQSSGKRLFNLKTGPLLCVELVQMAADQFELYLTVHHIASDGWGLTVLTNEWLRIYEALMQKRSVALDPPRQYRDVAVWMNKRIESGKLNVQLDYWRQKLAAPRPDLHFKLDRERPEFSAHRASRRAFDILPELTSRLTDLGRSENASLYMVLTAIWQTLLHHATGSQDIITGTAIANRSHEQLEQMVGTFINALALRTDFSGAISFSDVLQRVRRTALEAYAHQEIPFSAIMEAVDDGTRHPVFRNSLILHNMPHPPRRFHELTMSNDELGNDTSKMDALLYFIERDGQLEGQLEYDTEVFSSERADRLVDDFLMVARRAVENPARPLAECFQREIQDAPSCFVIGEGSLCLRCVNVLRRSGMRVLGLISPDEANRRWAKTEGVEWHHPDEGFKNILEGRPFDYLLSVVNSYIIKPEVLALPRRAAINYHDSPLPRYAGVYSTAWALINGEKQHGVSWHLMTEEVDAGDILKQTPVPIFAEDTSFTLNARCYDAAVSALKELAQELVEGRETPQSQDLTERTYYHLYKRPAHGALIDWSKPREQIDALRRALDFGFQPNELGLPKVLHNGSLCVLKTDGRLYELDGEPASGRFPPVGKSTDGLTNEPGVEDLGRDLYRMSVKYAPHERFWVRQLEKFQPLELLEGMEKFPQRFPLDDIPLFLCFLARFCSQEFLSIGLKVQVENRGFLADTVPLQLQLELDSSLQQARRSAESALEAAGKRGTFVQDVFLRYPSLGSMPVYPVSVGESDVFCSEKVWGHFIAFRRSVKMDAPLFSQSVLTDTDLRILEKFERRTRGFHDLRCIHQLFETQVRKTPNAIAVDGAFGALTYAELNRRADSLAICLQEQKVDPDMPVGLFVNRSLEMCIGILGILKAGAAYVPLDPEYPADRLEFIAGDTTMPVVLTVSALADRFPVQDGRVLCMDKLTDREGVPASVSGTFNLAYIFYTSGSTGKPKGVMVEHHNVVNHCRASIETYGINPKDRVLQFFSMNFDGSVEELFPAWACGGTVVLRSDALSSSIREFERFVKEYKITVADLPTAYWHEWVRNLCTLPKSLRAVIIGGEKVSAELCRIWMQKADGAVRLFNTYGPTECTVVATVHELIGVVRREVPIGLPIADTSLYVADSYGQRLPVGMPGELLIGGEGVARGYLNRPELTAEKFIPNPWGEGRLYRTGDLVFRRPDGEIAFVGRVDNQVKIRGFRVEPDEIAAVLEQHSGIGQAIVAARTDLSDQKELAAYYIPLPGSSPSIAELRAFLAENLPEYMIPSAFMELDEFPTAPGGKVDRKSLPLPVRITAGERENYVAPRSAEEKILWEIWSAVLGIKSIGIHDNFFDLGGHSLLAIQLVERVLASGSSLTVAQLFQYPTIAEMALVLDVRGEAEYKSLVCLKKGDERRPPFFLLHSAPGDLLGYSNLVHNLPQEQPVYGFQSLGLIDPGQVHSTISEMAAYYVSILQEFHPDGPCMLGGWCYGGYVAMEMARQLQERGREVCVLALIDAWAYPPSERRIAFYYHRFRLAGVVGWRVLAGILFERVKKRFGRDEMANAAQVLDHVQVKEGVLANREEVYRRNREAALKYTSRYYPGTVHIFRSDEIASTFLPDMAMEWGVLTADQEICLIPGGHRDMLREPSVKVLAEHLFNAIEKCLNNPECRERRRHEMGE